MADQWEMCWIWGDALTFFTLGSFEQLQQREFIKRHKEQAEKINSVSKRHDQYLTMSLILADGWEPYGSIGTNGFLYRRKYQG